MPHTASRYQQDLGFTDARLFLGPGEVIPSSLTNGPIVRNAAADWSFNQIVSQTVQYGANVTQAVLRRLGFGEDLQEQFGGSGIAGSAGPQGRPDTFGAMSAGQQLQPRTALKLKGFKLLSFDVVYLINTAALTAHTCRVDQSVSVNNVANAITSVLATGANGLATATQTNPYVTNVALSAAQQIYRNVADSQLWIEISAQTAATTAYRLYGIDCLIEFNFN